MDICKQSKEDCCKYYKKSASGEVNFPSMYAMAAPCSNPTKLHYSFDFAQHVNTTIHVLFANNRTHLLKTGALSC